VLREPDSRRDRRMGPGFRRDDERGWAKVHDTAYPRAKRKKNP
jgi:hypothetical protein